MKFSEMPLNIPSEKKIAKKVEKLSNALIEAKDAKTAIATVKKFFKLNDDLESDLTIIQVRNSINTEDPVYAKANDKLDMILPVISAHFQEFEKLMYESKFRKELEEKFGELLFKQIELGFKTFDEKIIPDLQKENQLVTEYSKLIAGAKIEFRGETYNMTQLGKYMSDIDRQTRIDAAKAFYGYIEEHDADFGRVYDELVKVRTSMAKKLGYKNFVELGYYRMSRLDYNPEMVEGYRKQIVKDVVPVVKKLRARQAKRIKIEKPLFIDYNLTYLSGNPRPVGNSEYLVKQAQKMYHEMSEVSGKFFDFMVENELMDLDAKPGKMSGGYMTFIPRYKSPFIFANSNGTSHDVDTLTHEVGHALQGYLTGNFVVPSYRMPTMDAAEIDSMSMEFFAWPWMENFFGDQADKYRFEHLDGAISFLPYGAEVDHFQHYVYENPDITHEERCAYWAKLEKMYRPWMNYDGFDYLKKGTFWIKQSHIFQSPFYYIDYTLAQVCALQFKCEMDKNREKAWKKYIKLSKMGGKYTFLKLLENDKLRNPFIDGNVKKVIKPQVKVLDSFDDSKF